MALSRQRAHERRLHELAIENQDLRKDVDKLEDALALHTSVKQAGELSVKEMIRNEIGGSIWQHGGEGKLTSYKSNKDLKSIYGFGNQEPNHTKRKATEDLPKLGKTIRTIEIGSKSSELLGGNKSRNKTVVVSPGGSNIGTKSHAAKLGSVLVLSANRLSNKAVDMSGCKKPGKTYMVADGAADHRFLEEVGGNRTKMNRTYKVNSQQENGRTVDMVSEVLNVKAMQNQTGSSHNRKSGVKAAKTEDRIQVLNTMIDKLRESWQLDADDPAVENDGGSKECMDPFVSDWLYGLNLKPTEKYVDIFERNEIDRESLRLLDECKLHDMGISAQGPLTKILQGIDELHRKDKRETKGKRGVIDSERRKGSCRANKSPCGQARKEIGGGTVGAGNGGDKPSPVQLKSVLTTKSGKNTFCPKALLSTLEGIKGAGGEADKSEESNLSSRMGRVSKIMGNTVSSLAKQKSPDSVRSTQTGGSGNRSGTGGTYRGSGSVSVVNSGRLQRNDAEKRTTSAMSARPNSAMAKKGFHKKSKAAIKDTESEFADSCLDGVVGIRTAIQDVSVDETDDNEGETDGDDTSTATDPLQTIEDQIVSLSTNQKQPEALEKINFLQERLQKIRAEIVQNTGVTKDTDSDVRADVNGDMKNDVISDVTKPSWGEDRLLGSKATSAVKNEVSTEIIADKVFGKPRRTDVPPTGKSRNYRGVEKGGKSKPVLDDADVKDEPIISENASQKGSNVASRNMSKTDLLKHVRKQKDQHRKQIRHLESELSRLKHKDPLRSCEICLSDLHYTTEDLIGQGGFSRVFHGMYQGSDVAVKRLKVPLSAQDKNYFMAEVNLLKDLRHPRVVLLVGVCTTSPLPLMVLEFMARGSLYQYLHNPDNPPLDHLAYYQIAKDTALGMNYLHLHKPAVLHLDLKSMNVLLSQQLRAKIADFGFSKLRHDADVKAKQSRGSSLRSGAKSHVKGTPAWLAPEMLDFREVTTKADVYSFGVILWEMFTRKRPYAGYSVFQVIEAVRTNKRPLLPADCPDQLSELMTRCWDKNPAKRPQFKDILLTLDLLHLPTEWRQLFEDAGVAMETLSDINSTRSLVHLVSTTINQIERPPDVPVLELYDSDTEEKGRMWMLALSDSESDCELPESERDNPFLDLPEKPFHEVRADYHHLVSTKPTAQNGDVTFTSSDHRGGVRSCTPKQQAADSMSHDIKEEVAFYDQLAQALQSWETSESGPSLTKEASQEKQSTFRVEGLWDSETEQAGESESGMTEEMVNIREQQGIVGKKDEQEQEVNTGNAGIDVVTEESQSCQVKPKSGSPVKRPLYRPKSSTPSSKSRLTPQRNSRPPTSQSTEIIKPNQPKLRTNFRPPPPPISTSDSGVTHKTVDKTPTIQPTLAGELRASRLVAQRSNLKVTADIAEDLEQKPKVSKGAAESRSSLRASMLVDQRGKLRSTDAPHPRQQLPDLGRVGQSQLCDLANILKKAVSERRIAMADTHTIESLGSGTWSVED